MHLPNRDATFHVLVVGLIADYKQAFEILSVLREWRQVDASPFDCRWVGAPSREAAYVRSFPSEMTTVKAEGWADY